MASPDQAVAKEERVVAVAQGCLDQSAICVAELESLHAASQGHKDKLRRPHSIQHLDLVARRISRKRAMLGKALKAYHEARESSVEDDGRRVDLMPLRNLTTEIENDFVRWRAFKHQSSALFFGRSFAGRTDEERKRLAEEIVDARAAAARSYHDDVKPEYGASDRMKGPGSAERAKEIQAVVKDLTGQDTVQVDVVEGGREWLDVRTLLPHRLAEHMTESGWDWGQYRPGDTIPREDCELIPLVKRVEWLTRAAKMNRVGYEIPRIRVCLPNIGRDNEEFAVLFEQMEKMDPDVEVIVEDKDSCIITNEPPTDWRQRLVQPRDFDLTHSVIVCRTIVNTLISDISHRNLCVEPWHGKQVRTQIAEENRGLNAAECVYPLLVGRELLITRSTVEHLRVTLDVVGTPTERERAAILISELAEPGGAVASHKEARRRFADLSVHPVPSDMQIPFRIVEGNWTRGTIAASSTLPPVALTVADLIGQNYDEMMLCMLLEAWAQDVTVVTGNAVLRKQMHRWVEQSRPSLGDKQRGPRIVEARTCRIMLSAEVGPPKVFYCEDGTEDRERMRNWRRSKGSKQLESEGPRQYSTR